MSTSWSIPKGVLLGAVLAACTAETGDEQRQGDLAEEPLLPYFYWSYVLDDGSGNRGSGRVGMGGLGAGGSGEGACGTPCGGWHAGGDGPGGASDGGAPAQGGTAGCDAGGGDTGGGGGSTCRGACSSQKAILCHVPPGNPGNAHTIAVGAPAVAAHLAHGDHLGGCGDGDRR